MNPSLERYIPNHERVAAKVMDGEAVIIDLLSGTYFSLVSAGGRVWELLEAGRTLDEIATVLASEYDVTEARARQDVHALLHQLRQELLIAEAGAGVSVEGAATVAGGETPTPAPSRRPYEAPTLQVFRDMQDLLALDPPMPGLKDIPWK